MPELNFTGNSHVLLYKKMKTKILSVVELYKRPKRTCKAAKAAASSFANASSPGSYTSRSATAAVRLAVCRLDMASYAVDNVSVTRGTATRSTNYHSFVFPV